ncbi:MAG: hypothetical protein J7L20_06080, partial [Thermoplasmata archaeon]|nr:hypothetical protein [Thermoplasmata archaeon]
YIDDVLRFTDHNEPYSWLWSEFAIGWHEIKVIAYDNKGNKAEDRINVIALNLEVRNEIYKRCEIFARCLGIGKNWAR